LKKHQTESERSFVSVARRSQLREGHALRVTIDQHDIALWLVHEKIYAIDNVCAHEHFPVLYRGSLDDCTVTCPMHGWSFSLESGIGTEGRGRIRTFRVKVEGDCVMVEQPESLW
jgi:3-phenylpropionate/trans-cinnamate dioxygenase ferredoxin subunit